MKNIFQIFGLMSVLFLFSCDEDFFEAEVAVDLPEHTPTLVVSGSLTAGENNAEFYISSSKSLQNQADLEAVQDASVRFFKNGNVLPTPEFNAATGLYEADLAAGDLESGAAYRLEVSHASFENVSSSQVMPSPAKIDSIEFMAQGTIDEFGDPADEYILEFTDTGNEENYYMIRAIIKNGQFNGVDTSYYLNEVDLSSLDPNVSYGFTGNYQSAPIFSDAAFNGKKYKLNLFSYWGFFDTDSSNLTVYLISLTRERYLYLLSLNSFYQSEDNPFAEPVTVAGNIENGQGAFGAQAVDSLVIRF